MLITGGAAFKNATLEQVLTIETSLIRLQMGMEDEFLRIAQSCGAPSVLICDRGTMDVSAYLPHAMWQALLDENGWNAVGLRDRRYDAVLHLVTAADGAEAFYTTANNSARTETPEEARVIDKKLRDVWVGHSHLRVIDNASDFAEKVRRVLKAVCHVTGVPEPVEIERKYLVKNAPRDLPVRHEDIEVEQTYLRTTDGSEARVRRRGQHGSYTYTHTIKKPLRSGQRVEVERPISGREFVGLLAQCDPSKKTVKKLRTCFLWEGQYFELDRLIEPQPGLVLLEAESDDETTSVKLPSFLEIDRDVTDEPAFSNYRIASS